MALSSSALKAVRTGIELAIPHEMSTPEWAETYRVVDRGARKGKWSNETVPFLTEIMAAADDPLVREIVFMKSSQVGGSEVINNILGKRIHQAPTEIIYCAETEDKATAWTQESFDSMVRATPELEAKISKKPEENNQKYKGFAGGGLYIVWATSPTPLSSRPAQIIFYDEKAAYKPTREGDPVKLGEARKKTYEGEELIVKISTPRRCDCADGEICGDISHDYERGDQREHYVPCPHCEEFQTLKFGGKDVAYGLKWEKDSPETPYYLCEHCGAVIEEFDLDDMLAKGYWRAAKPFNGIASFKINQLYSPLMNGAAWPSIVGDFLESCRSKSKLEVYTNTVLGETWKPVEQINYEQLAWNVEEYPADVPPGVLVITAGVDVQKARLECEIVGWGRNNESWSIDYRVLEGDTGTELFEGDDGTDLEPLSSVWKDLEDYLVGSFIGVDGQAFRVQCAAIDSGYNTQRVYQFCKLHERKRWFAIKGMSDPFAPMLSKPTLKGRNPKVRLFSIGTNAAKDEVFSALRTEKQGPGYCHFPNKPHYDEDYWKQLGSERMVTHTRGGRPYRVYEKVGANVRNEALDVRVYATVARDILNPNYEAIARRRLQHVEAADQPAVEYRDPTPPERPQPTHPAPKGKNNVVPIRGRSLTKNNPFEGYKP
jgi:phage terminase large subunit GpA-like protein